jgi:hypothetical protein
MNFEKPNLALTPPACRLDGENLALARCELRRLLEDSGKTMPKPPWFRVSSGSNCLDRSQGVGSLRRFAW